MLQGQTSKELITQSHQMELLDLARQKFGTLSDKVCEAFLSIPRHQFVSHFSVDFEEWIDLNENNLIKYLPLIYADGTLLLFNEGPYISTISQPSFVLRMLDLMDLQPGMKAFELGAGSGWNAGLMGYLVGKEGLVKSYEIIPSMAQAAIENISRMGLNQVEIIAGDAIAELKNAVPFDRGIFTAGANSFPAYFFDVIKPEGKLLFVLKTASGDLLLAMEKINDHFEVYQKMYCSFVPVTGEIQKKLERNHSAVYEARGKISLYRHEDEVEFRVE